MAFTQKKNSLLLFRKRAQIQNKFEIPAQDWEIATQFFKENPAAAKVSRKKANTTHSFLKINNNIYALKRGKALGVGAFGKVKIVQDKQGVNYAVKIEGFNSVEKLEHRLKARADLDESDIRSMIDDKFALDIQDAHDKRKAELKMMEEVGDLKGTAQVEKDGTKPFLNISNVDYKTYTLQTLHSGQELREKIKTISADQKLSLAIKALQDINALHERKIIHSDIKPENFLVDDNLRLLSIDFGLSSKVKSDHIIKKNVEGKPIVEGTPPYIAPEIIHSGRYSFASDTFALGTMLKNELLLLEISNSDITHLIQQMCDPNPVKRPTLSEAIIKLNKVHAELSQKNALLKANIHRVISQQQEIHLINDKMISELKHKFNQLQEQAKETKHEIEKCEKEQATEFKEQKLNLLNIKLIEQQKMLLSLPEKVKKKETLAKELEDRTKRLEGLLADNGKDLLLFTLSYKTPQEKLLQVKESLQQRIGTSVDNHEKTMLKEIYHKVDFAYRQKIERKPFQDIHIPCHQREIKYLKHRDFTVLKEADLKNSLSNHKNQQDLPKSHAKESLFYRFVNAIKNYLWKKDPAKLPASEALLPVRENQPEVVIPTIVTMPCQPISTITTPVVSHDSIAEHNRSVIETLKRYSHIEAPQGRQPIVGWSQGLSSNVSMQQQKQNIIQDILKQAIAQSIDTQAINLTKITDDLSAQYKGSPYENLLNHMVHYDNHIKLASLLENNQQFLQQQIPHAQTVTPVQPTSPRL